MEEIMIIAAIPVKNSLKWTAPLVEQLLLGDDIDYLWIYDNGSSDGTKAWVKHRQILDSRLIYIDASHMKFYEMWNDMVDMASNYAGAKLAILNNDIRLPHMALKIMATHMDGYQLAQVDGRRTSFDAIMDPHPSEIRWTERIGHAFMLDVAFWADQKYAVHPDFIIWFGDDDLFKRCAERGGRICEIRNVGCNHAWHESYLHYTSTHSSMSDDIREDKETFLRIWSGR
jgi:GT2 family glycosyltransferase